MNITKRLPIRKPLLLELVVGLVLIALAANAVRLAARRYRPMLFSQKPSHSFTPYTVVLRAVRYEDGKAPRIAWEETHALRSDGAYVQMERGQTDGGAYVRREIVLATGERLLLDDVNETKIVYPGSDVWRYSRDPNSSCVNARTGRPISSRGESIAGRSAIHRYGVVYLQSTLSTNAYAPALGCALLYGTTDKKLPQHMEKEPVSIANGEPDPILFAIPSTFVEQKQTETAENRR